MNPFVISTIAVAMTSYLGSYYTRQGVNSEWYQCIKSNITPPSYVFPIVWSILYIFIAYAFGIAIQSNNKTLIYLFIVNLIYNVFWCYLYFGKKKLGPALLIMGVLIGSVIQILRFAPNIITRLMVPYLIWLIFAACLNYDSISKETICTI